MSMFKVGTPLDYRGSSNSADSPNMALSEEVPFWVLDNKNLYNTFLPILLQVLIQFSKEFVLVKYTI